jgi:hypothetical protein
MGARALTLRARWLTPARMTRVWVPGARLRGLLVLAVLLAVSSCDQGAPASAVSYRLDLTMHEVMSEVLDPAADGVWGNVGFVITAAGEQNLAPTTDEGWLSVAHSGAVVAETANLLRLPGRARPGDWSEIAAGLADAGMAARAAALARDEDALFEAGGTIYRVCVSCHQIYLVGEE